MKKVFRKLHLWLSVPFGVFITLICLSGASLVFEAEITRWLQPELFYVRETGGKPLPAGRLASAAAAVLPDGVQVTGVTLFADPERTAQVNLTKRYSYVYVDPYTGEVKGESKRPAFFGFMFRLHRWMLGSAGSFGKTWVGICTLLFVIILITGVVLWWPPSRKALRHRLTFTVGKGWPHFWFHLHTVAGMYVLVFLLAMGLTGLTWSFGWYRTGFYKVFGVEAAARGGHASASQGGRPERGVGAERSEGRGRHGGEGRPEGSSERRGESLPEGGRPDRSSAEDRSAQGGRRGEGRPERTQREAHFAEEGPDRASHGESGPEEMFVCRPYVVWQKVYEELKAQCPGFETITVSEGKADVAFGRLGNRRASESYTFDARDGKILSHTAYRQSDPSGKLRGWIFSVHVGSWGGWITRILAFLSALIGASLPVTGYYLWIRRLMGKGKAHHGGREKARVRA